MAGDDFGPRVAETTVAYEDARLDPRYTVDRPRDPAPVWQESQVFRELIERAPPKPTAGERQLLVKALGRQLRTLGLFREISNLLAAAKEAKKKLTASLYIILFPGEGRDNTGLKDLNDKVLGYTYTNMFIAARHEEIEKLFPPPANAPVGPRFTTLGQDYKTATIIAVDKKPEDFAKDLVTLDARLRDRLLQVLDAAAKDPENKDKLKAIGELTKKLRKNPKYRFDFLFGTSVLGVEGHVMTVVFRLLTETLKGAGMARYAAKTKHIGRYIRKNYAEGRGIDNPKKGHDARGRVFSTGDVNDIDIYLNVTKAATVLKAAGVTLNANDLVRDLQTVYVDTVWTVAFLLRKRLYWGNPDMIRDVRKKLLKKPRARDGNKMFLDAQIDLLELWLVTLNLIDLIKDFVKGEFTRELWRYHIDALDALEQLSKQTFPPELWNLLSRILTRDLRQTQEPFIVHSRASEYQFFAYASDHSDQIFFSMDIRDLGVDLMTFYEISTKKIDDNKLGERDLLAETFVSSDQIVERKRFTYDQVVTVFKRYHVKLEQEVGHGPAADKAFGGPVAKTPMPDFRTSVRIMLGGDELFVSAHPYYARFESQIIRDLAKVPFADQPLNMRTAVAYSSAKRVPSKPGPRIGDPQRRENQIAHDEAMTLSTNATGALKPLERAHRRIERLVDKLDANNAKAVKGQFFRRSLGNLRLLQLYARVTTAYAGPMADEVYRRLRKLLRDENLFAALETKRVDLVDYESGAVVDGRKLKTDIEKLEDSVREEVGKDNFHIDVFLVTRMPKWIEKAIDKGEKILDELDKPPKAPTSLPPAAPPVTALVPPRQGPVESARS